MWMVRLHDSPGIRVARVWRGLTRATCCGVLQTTSKFAIIIMSSCSRL